MADPINANPTILNASDLPTRRGRPLSQKPSSTFGSGLFASTIPSSSYLSDPFSPAPLPRSESDSSSSDDGLTAEDEEEEEEEPIDEQEIYDLISTISDPEHPLSLGSLAVVNLADIHIASTLPRSPQSPLRTVSILLTPTITHCSLATVIGLGVRVRLEQSLPPRFRVDVRIKPGTHSTAEEVSKQLGDKERVAAALENGTLRGVLGKMLETCV